MKLKSIAIILPIAVISLFVILLAGFTYGNQGEIVKVKSGLITNDPLNNGKLTFSSSALGEKKPIMIAKNEGLPQWIYFGSAVPRKSPISVFEDPLQGLYLGIKATTPKSWTGFFSMSNDDYSTVYHTIINMPYRVISQDSFSAGLYVQTSIIYPHINYVACVAEVSPDGVKWVIESGTGTATEVTDRHVLWVDDNPALPLKRDCTIVTDGKKNYKVYFDHKLVYSANNLNLQMPMPFNSYLEVQTTNSKQFLYGIFTNYYSTLGEDIKIINAPAGGSVIAVTGNDTRSQIRIPTGSDGIAHLNMVSHKFPFSATLNVYDSKGELVASSKRPVNLAGGDVYSAVSVSPLQKWLLNG
jgi:hypothetical protein